MSDEPLSGRALTEALSRLPLDVAPPADLWARIATALDDEAADVAVRVTALPRVIEPEADLWPAIDRGIGSRHDRRRTGAPSLAAAASVGLVTIAALVSLFALQGRRMNDLAFATPPTVAALVEGIGASAGAAASPSERALRSATASIMQTLTAVRRERLALERALEGDRGNADLRALWLHAYETELTLTSEIGKVFELYERSLGI